MDTDSRQKLFAHIGLSIAVAAALFDWLLLPRVPDSAFGYTFLAVETSLIFFLAYRLADYSGFLFPFQRQKVLQQLGDSDPKKLRDVCDHLRGVAAVGWKLDPVTSFSLIRVLGAESETTSRYAEEALRKVLDRRRSLEGFAHLENTIENSFAAWEKEQPQRKTSERMRVRSDTAWFLQEIADRKADLVRAKDGELLTGETIAMPQRGNRVYRAIRMQS